MKNAIEGEGDSTATAQTATAPSKRPSSCIAYVGGSMYLGSRRARDIELLQALKITHVVVAVSNNKSLQHSDNFVADATNVGIKVLTVVAEDTPKEDMLAIYNGDKLNSFLGEGTSGNNKTLVHCFAGRARSATLIALHLIAAKGLTVFESLLLLLSARLTLQPNDNFIKGMKDLEKGMNKPSSFNDANLPGTNENLTSADEVASVEAKRDFFKKKEQLSCVKKLREKDPEPEETKLDIYKLRRFKDYEPIPSDA